MDLLQQLREESKHNLIFCFAGVGAAAAKKNAQTSLIIAAHGKLMLVDCGTTIPLEFHRMGLDLYGFDYYYITHSHADHIGGLEEMLLKFRYLYKKKPVFIITQNYQQTLWNSSLAGGLEINEDGLLRFSDYISPLRPEWLRTSPREIYSIELPDMGYFEFFRTYHVPGNVDSWDKAFWSTGILAHKQVLFTADTRFDPSLFGDISPIIRPRAIFHDVQLFNPGTVHATYDELKTLPDIYKQDMWLTHYQDSFADVTPENDGFRGFAKPWHFYKFPL